MDDSRLMLTDEAWGRLSAVIAGVRSRAGAPAEAPVRPRFRRGGACYPGLAPAAPGLRPARAIRAPPGDAVDRRSRRREAAGIWRAPFERLPGDLAGVEDLLPDSSVVSAPTARAAGAGGKGGQQAQALGRSRGGFGTKVRPGRRRTSRRPSPSS